MGDPPEKSEDIEVAEALLNHPAQDLSHEAWLPPRPFCWKRLLYNGFAGLEAGLLNVLEAVTLAALIFSHDHLKQHTASAINLGLFSSIVIGLVINVGSSFYFGVGGSPCATITPLLVELARHVADQAVEAGHSDDTVVASVIITIAISTIVSGASMYLMAVFELGGLIQYVPISVMAGFLAGNGWALLSGSLHLTSGLEVWDWSGLPSQKVGAVLYAVGLGVTLFICKLMATKHFPLLLPILLAAGTCGVYLIMGLHGWSIDDGKQRGWILDSNLDNRFWSGWVSANPLSASWEHVFMPFYWIFISLINMMTVLLSAIGLEAIHGVDANVNKELKANAYANLLAGAGVGMPGLTKIGISLIHKDAGASSRLAGAVGVVFVAAVFFFGGPMIQYFPLPVLGSMLFVIGAGLMWEYLVQRWHTMPWVDYLIVVTIVLTIAVKGCVVGCLVGMALVVLQFVWEASRLKLVQHSYDGSQLKSSLHRPDSQASILHERCHMIRTLRLQGSLFFGSSQQLLLLLQQLHSAASDSTAPKFAVLDFSAILYMDSSALECLRKLNSFVGPTKLDAIVVCGPVALLAPLRKLQIVETPEGKGPQLNTVSFEPNLDAALGWCEEQVLASADVQSSSQEATQALRALLDAKGRSAGVSPEAEFAFLQVFAEHSVSKDLTTLLPLVQYAEFSSHSTGEVLLWAVPPIEEASMLVVVGGSAEQYLTPNSPHKVADLAVGVLFGVEEFFTGTGSQHVYKAGSGGCSVATLTAESVQRLENDDAQLAQQFHQILCRHMASRLQKANTTSVNAPTAMHLELPARAPGDILDAVIAESGLTKDFLVEKKDE